MSYLESMQALPEFSQAVISLWFRVPKTSIDKATEAGAGSDAAMDGIIPLVIMGEKGKENAGPTFRTERVDLGTDTGSQYSGTSQDVSSEQIGTCEQYGPFSYKIQVTRTYTAGTFTTTTGNFYYKDQSVAIPSSEPGKPTNPTMIGVDCSRGTPRLYIKIETNKKPSVSNYAAQVTYSPGPVVSVPGPSVGSAGTVVTTGCSEPFGLLLPTLEAQQVEDLSPITSPKGSNVGNPVETYTDITEMYFNGTGSILVGTEEMGIKADKWHHVLISLDLKKDLSTHGRKSDTAPVGEAVDSAITVHVALDDTNYTKHDLARYWPDGYANPNGVINSDAYTIIEKGSEGGELPTYNLSSISVPEGVLGLPGTEDIKDNIYHVEMAEFQMWTNTVLDTGEDSNRRAFISSDGKPVTPSKAAILLGKQQILLHGSGNWKNGKSTGTATISFKRTGMVKPYKPDPILGEG